MLMVQFEENETKLNQLLIYFLQEKYDVLIHQKDL